MLSDSESEGENDVQLTINEHFAKAYELKKEREELSKLQDKYGSDAELYEEESEDSEDDETEDEDGEELTPAVDAAILRTLARIKRKDPEIYDAKRGVFEEEQQKTSDTKRTRTSSSKDKSKPLLMRQHILNSTLNPNSRSPSPVPALPTHVEEQAALRKETISAFHTAVSGPEDEEDDEDDLLIPREKTKDEIEHEEEEYREFLAREVGEDISKLVTVDENPFSAEAEAEKGVGTSSVIGSDKLKKNKKGKGKDKGRKEETDQEFLMNYILNRGWIDHSDRHIPTYKEITSTKAPKAKTKKGVEIGIDDADVEDEPFNAEETVGANEDGSNCVVDVPDDFDEEDFDDIADTFESSYNFRFEEPGAEAIATHPRNIDSTVRRDENPRKAARERKKERKEEKMLKKREEVKRLKALKLKELKAKLERIGKEGGLENLDEDVLAQLDLDADWDPEMHDKQMADIYDDGEDADVDDMEKPTWDDDIDISDLLSGPGPSSSKAEKEQDKKKKKEKEKEVAEDEVNGGVAEDMMEVDVPNGEDAVEDDEEAEWDGTEETRKKILDAYVSQKLDALDFNDMIGDMPTRFHYMPVEASTYGLTPAEILLADDADLNTYVGLKKIAPYRRGGKKHGKSKNGEPWDPIGQAKLREFREKLKEKQKKMGINLNDKQGGESGEGKLKKRMGKKERLKRKLSTAANVEEPSEEGEGKAGDGTTASNNQSSSNERLADEEPRTKKRKHKHKSVA
ncbi:Krr1-domain-containing protein [Schizopora paradoxa]|uniref:Krr1-domain-containing protein n=1 Tax=Schizopora paradoxa TaxID=27342 RepID=A0A0H2RGW4_9AGAM|nr:Krr1-domain-containing protein [Schizopora paradoxa]